MNDLLTLALAGTAGGILGTIFFGGLWLTIRKGVASKRPALLFSASLLLRMGIALTGFHLVGRGHGDRLATCLLGFFMARLAVTWLTRTAKPSTGLTREAHHAPEPR
jgi:F1F0 ATPase subunit 2